MYKDIVSTLKQAALLFISTSLRGDEMLNVCFQHTDELGERLVVDRVDDEFIYATSAERPVRIELSALDVDTLAYIADEIVEKRMSGKWQK